METNKIREKIIEIIAQNRGKSNFEFKDTTSLMNDLGIDGDDALEIINEYFRIFSVDKSNFTFEDYFGYEGFNPLISLKTIFLGNGLKDLTIIDLIDFAESGIWGQRIIKV